MCPACTSASLGPRAPARHQAQQGRVSGTNARAQARVGRACPGPTAGSGLRGHARAAPALGHPGLAPVCSPLPTLQQTELGTVAGQPQWTCEPPRPWPRPTAHAKSSFPPNPPAVFRPRNVLVCSAFLWGRGSSHPSPTVEKGKLRHRCSESPEVQPGLARASPCLRPSSCLTL